MRLESTIQSRLFRVYPNRDASINDLNNFVIECKAEKGKPVPLCMPRDIFNHSDLVYRKLYLTGSGGFCCERSTPRAMYNWIFNGYSIHDPLKKIKVKDNIYYAAPGVLFNSDKEVLFYFAIERDSRFHAVPRLYLTPTLFIDASMPSKPMEKFFMSTIVPFVMSTDIYIDNNYKRTIVEIDNEPDRTFFIPSGRLVETVPVDKINDKLSDILAANADMLSVFIENYAEH